MSSTALVRQIWAELIKARRRGLYLGALAVLLVLAILPLAAAVAAWRDQNYRDWATDLVVFPSCLWNTTRLMQMLLPNLSVIIGAGVAGGEYVAGTWKMILPRTAARSSALVARFISAVLLCLSGLICALVVAVSASALGAALLGVPFVSGDQTAGLGALPLASAFFLLQFGIDISIGILAGILTRSVIGGAFAGILGAYLIRSGVMLPGGWLWPFAHLDYIEARWLPNGRTSVSTMEGVFGRPIPWETSLASVLVFTAIFSALAMWFFGRRDIASD